MKIYRREPPAPYDSPTHHRVVGGTVFINRGVHLMNTAFIGCFLVVDTPRELPNEGSISGSLLAEVLTDTAELVKNVYVEGCSVQTLTAYGQTAADDAIRRAKGESADRSPAIGDSHTEDTIGWFRSKLIQLLFHLLRSLS